MQNNKDLTALRRFVGAGLGTALAIGIAATPANADPYFALEGLFLWGNDWIDFSGDPPEDYPGVLDFGNGPSGAAILRLGSTPMFGQVSLRYLHTSNFGEATRTSIFGTTVETVDLWKSFLSVDADIGFSVGGPSHSVAFMAGIRYLNAQHNVDDFAETTGGAIYTYGYTEDRTVFEGTGPHFAMEGTAELADRVSVFGGVGGAVLFGQTRIDRYVELGVGQNPPGTSRDISSIASTAYAFDAQVGLTFALGPAAPSPSLSLGYRFEAWWYTHEGQLLDEYFLETSEVAIHHGAFVRLTLPLP